MTNPYAGPVRKIVQFSLNPRSKPNAFVAAAKAGEAALRQMPGYRARTLCHSQGRWSDLVHWQDRDCAAATAAALMSDPAFADFMAMIDPASVILSHHQVRWQKA